MDMTTETIKQISDLAIQANDKRVITLNDRNYYINGDGDIRSIIPENRSRELVYVSTLTGLVDFIKNMEERKDVKLFVQVVDPETVSVYGALDKYGRRESLVIAKANLPKIRYNSFLDQEEMVIMLQSQFVDNDDRDTLLKVVGNLKEESVQSANDDGVSQAVTIKSGVASVGKVRVPNPVLLAPYRTFNELFQPMSKFIFRMREGMMSAIFEADGGAWQNESMLSIQRYLKDALSEEVESNHIVVLA